MVAKRTACAVMLATTIAGCSSGTHVRTLHGTINYYSYYDEEAQQAVAQVTGVQPPPPGCGPLSIPAISMNIKDGSGKVLQVVTPHDLLEGPDTGTKYTHCYARFTVTVPDSTVYVLADDQDSGDTITVNAADLKHGQLPSFQFASTP